MNLAQAQAAIVAKARSLLGTPYVYGVTDCEWLTRQCALAIGVTIPWGATEQYDDKALPHVTGVNAYPTELARALEPGDFVYFHDIGDPPGEDHCGVYISPGLMIDAPFTGAVTRYDRFSTTSAYGVLQYVGAVRVAALVATPTQPVLMLTNPWTTGLAVGVLQADLNRHGAKLKIDEVFGPLTRPRSRSSRRYGASWSMASSGLSPGLSCRDASHRNGQSQDKRKAGQNHGRN